MEVFVHGIGREFKQKWGVKPGIQYLQNIQSPVEVAYSLTLINKCHTLLSQHHNDESEKGVHFYLRKC